jgi:hypothetical protein
MLITLPAQGNMAPISVFIDPQTGNHLDLGMIERRGEGVSPTMHHQLKTFHPLRILSRDGP